jgi:hypothetical protein
MEAFTLKKVSCVKVRHFEKKRVKHASGVGPLER